MSNLDLSNLDFDALRKITKDAESLMKQKRGERLAQAYQQFLQIAKDAGTTVEEIIQVGKKAKRARNIAYQNPADPKQNWTGRGRKPNWLEEALAKGKKLEDFKI